jgi:hypothetical protein
MTTGDQPEMGGIEERVEQIAEEIVGEQPVEVITDRAAAEAAAGDEPIQEV